MIIKRKKINLAIKKTMQLRYLKMVCLSIFLLMVIIGLTVYFTFNLVLSTAQLGRYAEARLGEVMGRLNLIFLVEGLVFLLVGGYLTLRITHRIAGPLYRLERVIREEIDGVPFEIKLRPGDEMQELAEALNELIKKFTGGHGKKDISKNESA